LGLGGEKPLRKVAALSGGEKARVALSMSALKASNLLMLDEPSNVSSVFVCNLVATTYFCLIFNTSVSFSKTKNLAPRRRMHPRTRDLEDDRDLFYLAAESLLDRIKEMYTPAVSFKRKTIEHKGKLSNNMILNPFTFVPSPVKSTSILYGT